MENAEQNEFRANRLSNLARLQELGYAPFGSAFERTGRLAEIRAGFEEEAPVRAAGRMITIRNMGKTIFADLHDGSDRFQLFLNKKQLGDAPFEALRWLDVGDHIGVEGKLFVTRTGEQTIRVEQWTLLGKALLPLPEKWHGLRDVEARYRQRYLDLVANPEVRATFDKRIAMLRQIRAFLAGRGFSEVETPMMQPQPGGAAAKPFVTHFDALSTDMYLRIAPELYLKRLLVGGFDKVFELNRNFRNEGLSRTHNPEFTMLEIYEAYTDVRGMMQLVEDLILHVADTVFGTRKVGTESEPIDLTPPWREVAYHELIKEKMGGEWFTLPREQARERAAALDLEIDPAWSHLEITHEIYEKTIEQTLQQPTFVTRFPAELVPLAKTCPDDSAVVDVFELEIGGKEIAPAYSELNDPLEQRKRFEQQVGPDAQRVDEAFLTALDHGMPPAGGMGLGIDRLMMVLSGIDAIRDVILFPQLKPKTG